MERHRLDALSLVFGLLFVGVGLLLLSGGPAFGESLPLQWVGPLVAIGLGVVLVIAARPQRAEHPDSDDEGTEPGT